MEPQEIIKKAIFGSTILITLATVGMVSSIYVDRDIKLSEDKYTKYEYEQIKPELLARVKNRTKTEITYEEFKMWSDVIDIELKNCPGSISDVTNENVADKLNDHIIKCDK